MRKLYTQELLAILAVYDFYSWEEKEAPRQFWFVQNIGQSDFYKGWGLDAVDNPHADRPLTVAEWLEYEERFFNWLQSREHLLLPAIVTPELSNWWEPNMLREWMLPDAERCRHLLAEAGVIHVSPSLDPDLRGAVVETWEELLILGKMAVRGLPLLFFSGGKRVYRLTEYLTVLLEEK
ncbi:hypothetical protein CBW65_13240 [Tumebacillus avium]|uniref:Uncharacterized protein n=1 Tax=Tumebacillus avium TaxID=1903704 RepID=A0A1Y0IPD4_9BACL|nr:hypothetical protein [Tumebacillus avium]ARU61889.1 hypothetical protein CBW65_13240 [Tumebacillus avium]